MPPRDLAVAMVWRAFVRKTCKTLQYPNWSRPALARELTRMSAKIRHVFPLLLIVTSTATFAIIGELNALKVLSLAEDCACYPGVTVWGYLSDVLAFFLVLNVFLLPIWFSRMLAKLGMVLLVAVELVVYGWAFTIVASNLSTTHPTPEGFFLVGVVPVVTVLACGYLFHAMTLLHRLGTRVWSRQ